MLIMLSYVLTNNPEALKCSFICPSLFWLTNEVHVSLGFLF